MSGVIHAVKSVFKGVVNVVRKIWRPLAIAAAVYFTAGALAPMFAGGAAAAAEGGAALGADAAGAGLLGGDIGSMATAGIGALGGDAAAAGGMSAIAGGAGEAAFGGLSAGAADAGAGAAAGGLVGDAVGGAATGASPSGFSMLDSVPGASYGAAPASSSFSMLNGVPGASYGTSQGAATAGVADTGGQSLLSQGWQKAMDTAGWLEKHPTMAMGLLQGAGGVLKGIQQADMMNQQYKWAAAHAPYQTSNPVGNPFSGFQYNSLLSKQDPQNYRAPLPVQPPRPNPYQTGQMAPVNPQTLPQNAAFNPLNPAQRQQMMTSGLMSQGAGMPFVEGPHDEGVLGSYA